jgi:hypothetical protein
MDTWVDTWIDTETDSRVEETETEPQWNMQCRAAVVLTGIWAKQKLFLNIDPMAAHPSPLNMTFNVDLDLQVNVCTHLCTWTGNTHTLHTIDTGSSGIWK